MFLKKGWYAAAWADELDDGTLTRTITGMPVVMWRDTNGMAHALHDRCPHRFAPLSMGRRHADGIQCGYHGLVFDGSGSCVAAPNERRLPKARVRRFPLIERHTLLWIWMGDEAHADPKDIPDYALLTDESMGWRAGGAGNYLNIAANHLLLVDNLLDLSHVAYLHPTTLAPTAPRVDEGELTVHRDDRAVTASLLISDVAAPWQGGQHVDQWLDMRWEPPGSLWLEIGWVPAGQPITKGGNGYAIHLVTPETETTTHYFFGSARRQSHMGEKTSMDAAFQTARWAFENEDGPMLAGCEARMEGQALHELDPLWLEGDRAAGVARQVMRNLLEMEKP